MIETLGFSPVTLSGETAVITGAGGGIGYEAARALLWLGANVVIAEINSRTGAEAERKLAGEFDSSRVTFIQTDVGDEASVDRLVEECLQRFGKVDIVINNATIARLGLVKDLPIETWDESYRVNLRGPVLMARSFLPGMLERDKGVFVCVSSTGTAYMGAYESFKAAQVHLANTLDAELEGTGVIAFTIGPGLVPTETATKAVAQLAPQMGMSAEEFFEENAAAVISAEEAGTGFAVAIVLAEQFRGQEISSIQALKAAIPAQGVKEHISEAQPGPSQFTRSEKHENQADVLLLCQRVQATLWEQSEGWKQRSLFERQWVLRDFKKTAGMPVEQWLDTLSRLKTHLERRDWQAARAMNTPLEKLADYYAHLAELAKGYEKDPEKLQENLRHVHGWQEEVDQLRQALSVMEIPTQW